MNYLGIEVPEIVWILDFIERIQSLMLAFFFYIVFLVLRYTAYDWFCTLVHLFRSAKSVKNTEFKPKIVIVFPRVQSEIEHNEN